VEAEQCIHYKKSFELSRAPILEEKLIKKVMSKQEAICNVGIRTAEEINASLIIVITETGSTARLLAKSRPKQGILALCMSSGTIRQLKITRGVIPLKIPSFSGSENLISQSILFAKDKGFIKKGDKIVCILGENEETPDYASMMKITIVL
jgi:pyruvate kinase